MRRIAVVSCCLIALGCGSQSSTTENVTPSAPSAGPASASPSTAAPPAPVAPVAGPTRYHLEGPIDVVNLELDEAAGTFRWGVTGCDYRHFDRGVLRREGSELVLTAAPGATLTWFHSPGYRNDVDAVRVSVGPTELTATATIRGEPVTQRWPAGATCPECGEVGPASHHACDAPYLGD